MQPLILAPGSYQHEYGDNAPLRLVNVYAERMEGMALKEFILRGAPGMLEFSDPTASVQTGAAGQTCRALFSFNGTVYAIIGQFLIALASNGTPTEPFSGTSIPGVATTPVAVAVNRTPECFIAVPGGQDMIITGGALGQATGANLVSFKDVAQIGGRLVGIPDDQTGEQGVVKFSNADAFTSFESDGFFNAESHPDGSSAILRVGQLIIVFGNDTTEPFYLDSNSQFQSHASMIREVGIAAPYSRASIAGADANYGFFLAKSQQSRLSVQMIAESGQLTRISTNALDETMDDFATYSDAIGSCYAEKGHSFYVLNFPTAKRCFVYDVATGQWHDRQSGTKEVGGWDGRHIHVAHDKILTGSTDGKIYSLDKDTYTDRGNTRLRMFMAMAQASGGTHNTVGKVGLQMKTGITPASATTESKMMLEWSRNGGKDFQPDTRYRGLGLLGYDLDDGGPDWAGFGKCTGSFVTKFKMTDPGELYVKDAFADATPGAGR